MIKRYIALILAITTLFNVPFFAYADEEGYVFGSYEQDGNVENGKEPIEWIVLDTVGSRKLLLSLYALDCQKYNEDNKDTTWEKSSLRMWLNNEFVVEAFSEKEQHSIIETQVINSSSECNSDWNTNGGGNTRDKVFLLSASEYCRYFPSNDDTCHNTNYARKQGAKIWGFNKTCTWWLRSPGEKQNEAASVGIGKIDSCFVSFNGTGIRPALWIDTYAHVYEQNGEINTAFTLDDGTDNYGTLGGTIAGNQSTINVTAGEEVFHAHQGHGYAAEAANIQAAEAAGNNVVHTGGNNVENGPDYIIINQNDITQIQTKYYKTAKDTIDACFNNGKFRYMADESTPMLIEVPKDQYDDAIIEMQKRILNGEVPGVEKPAEAKNIVRQGAVTYKEAVNIAKAGTIDSLKYDAKNSAVSCKTAFGISATIMFATSIWADEDVETALKNSIYTGLSIGGNAFITGILAGQLVKAGLNSMLVPASEAFISVVGPKAAAVIANASRLGVAPIYGAAAMKSAAKMLRGNIITGTISVALFTVPDVINMFRGRVSGKQLIKDLATTAGGIAGGTAGGVAGASAGGVAGTAAAAGAGALLGSVVPGIGTVVGGIVGGVIGIAGMVGGAVAGSAATEAVMGIFIEDDANEMLDIISETFQELADEYLLNQEEAEKVAKILQNQLTGEILKDMHASEDRNQYARDIIEPIVSKVVNSRQIIVFPSNDIIAEELIDVLEEINEMELANMEAE